MTAAGGKGAETTETLIEEAKESVGGAAEALKEKLGEAAEGFKESVEEIISEAKEKLSGHTEPEDTEKKS